MPEQTYFSESKDNLLRSKGVDPAIAYSKLQELSKFKNPSLSANPLVETEVQVGNDYVYNDTNSFTEQFLNSYINQVYLTTPKGFTNLIPTVGLAIAGDNTKAADFFDKWIEGSTKFFDSGKQKVTATDRFIDNPSLLGFASGLGQGVGFVATSLLGGVLGKAANYGKFGQYAIGTAINTPVMQTMYYEEALNNGLSKKDAAKFSSALAPISALSEYFGFEMMGNAITKPILSQIRKKAMLEGVKEFAAKGATQEGFHSAASLMSKAYAESFKDVLKNIGTRGIQAGFAEGSQEFGQSYMEEGAKQIYDTYFAKDAEAKFGADVRTHFKDAANEAFFGGVIGVAIGSGGGAMYNPIFEESLFNIIDKAKNKEAIAAKIKKDIAKQTSLKKLSLEEAEHGNNLIDKIVTFTSQDLPQTVTNPIARFQALRLNDIKTDLEGKMKGNPILIPDYIPQQIGEIEKAMKQIGNSDAPIADFNAVLEKLNNIEQETKLKNQEQENEEIQENETEEKIGESNEENDVLTTSPQSEQGEGKTEEVVAPPVPVIEAERTKEVIEQDIARAEKTVKNTEKEIKKLRGTKLRKGETQELRDAKIANLEAKKTLLENKINEFSAEIGSQEAGIEEAENIGEAVEAGDTGVSGEVESVDVVEESKKLQKLELSVDENGNNTDTKLSIVNKIKDTINKLGVPYKNVVANKKGNKYSVITKDGEVFEVTKLTAIKGKILPSTIDNSKWVEHALSMPTKQNSEPTKQETVTEVKEESSEKADKYEGYTVIYKGQKGVIKKEGDKFVIETDSNIYEFSEGNFGIKENNITFPKRDTPRKKYNISVTDENTAVIEGENYEIIKDEKGNTVALKGENRTIRNEDALIQADIQINKMPTTSAEYEVINEQLVEQGYDFNEIEAIDNMLSQNMTDRIANLLDNGFENAEEGDFIQIELFIENAIGVIDNNFYENEYAKDIKEQLINIQKIADNEYDNRLKENSVEQNKKTPIVERERVVQPTTQQSKTDTTEKAKKETTGIDALEADFNEKSVEDLVALKKELYPNPDIESAMSPEEKLLDRVIAKKFSEKNQEVIKRREAKRQQKPESAEVQSEDVEEQKSEINSNKTFEQKYNISNEAVSNEIAKVNEYSPYRAIDTALQNLGIEESLVNSAKADYLKEFIEGDLPTKIPNKKNKFNSADLPQDYINPKPIIKPVSPLKDNTTKTKAESLKGIVSDDALRPHMTGVFYDKENKVLVATDAHKLVKIKDSNIKKTAIIDFKGNEIEGKFPNYDAVIPYDNPIRLDVSIKEIRPKLEGIIRANKFFEEVSIIAEIKFGDTTYLFHADLLNELLKVLEAHGHDKVTMELSLPNRAMVINEGDITALVMPIFLNDESKFRVSNIINIEPTTELLQRQAEFQRKADIRNVEYTINSVEKDVEQYEKDLSESKEELSDARSRIRNSKSKDDLDRANYDVSIGEKEVEQNERWLERAKNKLTILKEDLKKLQNEPIKPISETPDNKQESVVEDIERNANSEIEVEVVNAIEQAEEVIKEEKKTVTKSISKKDTGLIDGLNNIKSNKPALALVQVSYDRGVIPEKLYNEFGLELSELKKDKKGKVDTAEVAQIIQKYSELPNIKKEDEEARIRQEEINKEYEETSEIRNSQIEESIVEMEEAEINPVKEEEIMEVKPSESSEYIGKTATFTFIGEEMTGVISEDEGKNVTIDVMERGRMMHYPISKDKIKIEGVTQEQVKKAKKVRENIKFEQDVINNAIGEKNAEDIVDNMEENGDIKIECE